MIDLDPDPNRVFLRRQAEPEFRDGGGLRLVYPVCASQHGPRCGFLLIVL